MLCFPCILQYIWNSRIIQNLLMHLVPYWLMQWKFHNLVSSKFLHLISKQHRCTFWILHVSVKISGFVAEFTLFAQLLYSLVSAKLSFPKRQFKSLFKIHLVISISFKDELYLIRGTSLCPFAGHPLGQALLVSTLNLWQHVNKWRHQPITLT